MKREDKVTLSVISLTGAFMLFVMTGGSPKLHTVKLMDGTKLHCEDVEKGNGFVVLTGCTDGHTHITHGDVEVYDEKLQ